MLNPLKMWALGTPSFGQQLMVRVLEKSAHKPDWKVANKVLMQIRAGVWSSLTRFSYRKLGFAAESRKGGSKHCEEPVAVL